MKRRLALLCSAFDSKDIPHFVFILGLCLIGYGLSQIGHGYGPAVVGVFVIFYARPLSRWMK